MMTYGYPIQDHNDPFIDIVDKATEQFAVASMPGAFLVDTFPWRKYTIFRDFNMLIALAEPSNSSILCT